ncbi:MAG: sulfatase-like hydrolase/transferase [Candidatus Hydrogenedentota bacterium]
MIEHMDIAVGRVLDALDDAGVSDNTLVVFFSDNGGKHNVTTNAPLRGAKSQLYESGSREKHCRKKASPFTSGSSFLREVVSARSRAWTQSRVSRCANVSIYCEF